MNEPSDGPTEAVQITRSGFVAVAGRPNAGKSTLVNRLVGQHVAIVSPIAQTTRRVVRAVVNSGDAQIVFVDLPGSQKPVDRLTTRMQGAVLSSLGDVDAVLWVIDMEDEPRAGEHAVADLVFGAGVPVVIAANKIDRLHPPGILERLTQLGNLIGDRPYHAMVPISALTGDGADLIVTELAQLLPAGPQYYPTGDVTDMRESERVAEYVREAALKHMREELPHATIVEVVEMEDHDDLLHVECIIWVESESQVGIVVGKGGERIKQIGTDARYVIEVSLGRKAFLELRVKVRKHWRDDDAQLERWGL